MSYPRTSSREITQTSNESPARDAAVLFSAGERLAQEQLRIQGVAAPIVGGSTLPAIVERDGRVSVITALLERPIAPPVVRVQAPSSL